MTLNPFFLQGSRNEQFLIQDLINEQLKIYGIDVIYLPRKIFKTDDIIKEIQSSKFDDSFLLEAYLNNYDGYSPDSDIMTKFGLRLKNEISLTISRERFEEFIVPFLEGISSGINEGLILEYDFANLVSRPKEGDLIYFPLGERLFEIKRVESEKPFYQLGSNYIYELSCELFEYENELIDTSIEELDFTIKDQGYITNIVLVGTSVTSTASATIATGSVTEIFLNNDGYGYTSNPNVIFSDPPPGGIVATAVAITSSKGNVNSIKKIELLNAGSGYINPPTITISGGGSGAAATCSIGGTQFSVNSILVENGGKGYSVTPEVQINGDVGLGITAKAVAIVDNGSISSIRIVNPGLGYTQPPTITFSDFPTIGFGTYIYNEDVIGQLSGTSAKVREFKIIESQIPGVLPVFSLNVSLNNGKFLPGEILVGSISSARYAISSYDINNYSEKYDSNEEIEIQADTIINFSESNPFGEY